MHHVDRPPDETPRPTDTPPTTAGLHAAVELADAVADLLAHGPEFLDEIHATSGLRLGQIRALHAVEQGSSSTRDVARATGEHPDAATATLRTLCEADLIRYDENARVVQATVTETGRARLDQLTALHLRHMARLADQPGTSPKASVLTLRPRQPVRSAHQRPFPPPAA